MEEVNFTCISCRVAITASRDDIGELMQCPSCGQTMKIPVYGVIPGMKIGDFTIEKCLGVGGMGEVWLATQESLHRKVALKILSSEIADDKNFVKRFLQEVKIAGKLTHPNIVMAYHAGEQDGILYLVISYIDGKLLGEMVENGQALSEDEALRIIREIAKALKYAWEKFNILHRDIKPDNIMICHDGTPMLMDMGISKITSDLDESLTLTGTIVGTPYYISPEQARAQTDLDFRSDQYSLGATLFHLLTGQLPYRATSAMGILAQHLQDPIPDCRKLNSSISDGCNHLIQKMMAKSPDDRFLAWNELINAIDQLLPPGMRDSTPLPGTVPSLPAKKSKVPLYIITALVLLLLLAIVSLRKQLKQTKIENQGLKELQEPIDNSKKFIDREIDKTSNMQQSNTEVRTPSIKKPRAFVKTVSDTSKPVSKKTNKDAKSDSDDKIKKKLREKFKLDESDVNKLIGIVKQYKKELRKIFSTASGVRRGGRFRKIGEIRQLQHKAVEKATSVLEFNQRKDFKFFLMDETKKLHKKRRGEFYER
jgi:serine/threonine protein kinase